MWTGGRQEKKIGANFRSLQNPDVQGSGKIEFRAMKSAKVLADKWVLFGGRTTMKMTLSRALNTLRSSQSNLRRRVFSNQVLPWW